MLEALKGTLCSYSEIPNAKGFVQGWRCCLNVGVSTISPPVVQWVSCLVSDFVQSLVLQATSFDEKQDSSWEEHHRAWTGESERPAHVVVLPVGHPVAWVTITTEQYDGEQGENAWNHQTRAVRDEKVDVSLMILRACEEQEGQQHGYQQQGEGEREEKLDGQEERREKVVVDDVVFLLEDPHATREPDVVEAVNILKILKTHRPQS